MGGYGGHLEKRSANSWTIVIEAGRDPSTGKRKRIKRAFRGQKSEAKKEMARLIAELEKGTYVEPTKMNVAEFLQWWLKSYCKIKLRPLVYDTYKTICEKHLIPALGAVKLNKLHQAHIQDYISKALKNGRADGTGGLSARTVQFHHRVLSKALNYAVQCKMLNYNVARDVQAPIPQKKEIKPLDAEEVQQLLTAAKGHRDYLIIYTAVHTGMRRGEILGLKWQDVNFDKRIINVKRSLQYRKDEGFTFGPPKNGHGRPVPLPKDLIQLLKEHKLKQPTNIFDKDSLIFTEKNGEPIKPGNLSHRFKNLVKKAGLSGTRFHDLRHTWATLALSAGLHPKYVQAILGHSSITVTMDTYSHVQPVMFLEASDKISEVISGGQFGAQMVPTGANLVPKDI